MNRADMCFAWGMCMCTVHRYMCRKDLYFVINLAACFRIS